MGVGLAKRCSVYSGVPQASIPVDAVNPDPSRFKITDYYEHASYLAVKVNYPNCTNYEGNKVLVFHRVTLKELLKRTVLDPHFSKNDKFSPIARFKPDDSGWNMAISFVKHLSF